MTKIIDFDLLFNEQLRAINNPKIKDYMKISRLDLSIILREFRTIIINSPRQSGRTTWMVDKASKLHGRIIVKDKGEKHFLIKNNPNIQQKAVLTLHDLLNANPIDIDDYNEITSITFVADHLVALDKHNILFYKSLSRIVDENHLVVLC